MNMHPDSTETQSDMEQMFRQFQNTRFYAWLDRCIAGRFSWMILPIVGFIDAFVIVIPTELAISMYMMRNKQALWWWHTLVASVFAGVGYVLLALIVSLFGINAVEWLSFAIGDYALVINQTVSDHIVLFAASAGITSFFPMPATVFAVVVGLFNESLVFLFIGTVIGKFVRFGIFAYGARQWGDSALQYYFKYANTITVILIVLIVLYIFVR